MSRDYREPSNFENVCAGLLALFLFLLYLLTPTA